MTLIQRWAVAQLRTLLSTEMSWFDRLIIVAMFVGLSTWLRWWFVTPWLLYFAAVLCPVLLALSRGRAAPLIDYLAGQEGETTDHPET